MMGLALQLVSPEGAVAQLEEAQCAPSATVGSKLRALVPRLSRTQPLVSEAALTLVQIHPRETLPYLPDLLSANLEDTTNALEILSTLLRSDRKLLVPIIATLPQLPLSSQNVVHARATLAFAFDVVGQDDLPAVIHALLHTPTSAASAAWASRSVRMGLARASLNPSSTPLIAHVLGSVLHIDSKVSRSLRSQAGSPFLWPDLLIWGLTFTRRLPSLLPIRQARTSIRAAATCALLTNPNALHAASQQLAPALNEMPFAVERLALAVVTSCLPHIAQVAGAIHFVLALISACPSAAPQIATLLELHSAILPRIILRGLARLGIPVPTFSPAATFSRGSTAGGHAPVFLKIRKYLLFGQEADRCRALLIANTICDHASIPVTRDLLTLLHESVPLSLADGAAIGTLSIITNALMAGVKDEAFFNDVLEKRVLAQCPHGCFEEQVGHDARAIGIRDAVAVKIDVGLVWDQHPAAVASVASAAVLCFVVRRNIPFLDSLSFHVLNVAVLVPVVCVDLYEAVDRLSEMTKVGDWNLILKELFETPAADTTIELPESLLNMDSHALFKAIKTFSTGIAVIIGILNTACKSLERFKRVIDGRASSKGDEHENSDHRATWALWERLTELCHMMNALLLAHRLLGQRSGHNRAKRGRPSLTSANGMKLPSQRSYDRFARARAEDILMAVRNALSPGKRTPAESLGDVGLEAFPSLRLETIIGALLAVPDESEMHSKEVMACVERDYELLQVDRLLLRLLLHIITEPTTPSQRVFRADGEDPNSYEDEAFAEKVSLPCSSRTTLQAHKMTQSEMGAYFENIQEQVDRCNDIFFDEDDVHEEENLESEEVRSNTCNVKWAASSLPSSVDGMEYIDDAISALVAGDASTLHASAVLHTPAFAALLLDRASTYVAVSRNARLKTVSKSHLGELVMISGMALRAFVYILREIPTFAASISERVSETVPTDSGEFDTVLSFVRKINEKVLTRLGSTFKQDQRLVSCEDELVNGFHRIYHTLEWIRLTTPDSIVAGLAVEAHLTLAELGMIPPSCARQAVFRSLCTVYEFDRGNLWNDDERYLVIHDSFQQWLLRKRGRISLKDACEIHDIADKFPECPPWMEFKNPGRKNLLIECYRLNMFFAGMNLNCALLEACGWVRELCLIVSNTKSDAARSNVKRHMVCDSLIDMVGFRPIIGTLLQLTISGLEAFSVDDSLHFSRAHKENESPLVGLAMCVRLFCGIQQLYGDNHEALMAYIRASGKALDLDVDEGLEGDVIRACISVLHLSQRRLEELQQWYSNESMEVRQLNNQSQLYLQHIVGGLACAVCECVRLVRIVREMDGQAGDDSEEKKHRKSPGFVKKRRKRGDGKKNNENDMTRGRRLLPRLADVCEQVRKGGAKFATSLGISSSLNLENLAAKDVSDDKSFYFGVGLAALRNSETNDEDPSLNDEEIDGEVESNSDDDVEDIQGFHARGASDNNEDAAPISVQLRRRNADGTLG